MDPELTRLLAVGIAMENNHALAAITAGHVRPGPNTLAMARQMVVDAMGKADWLWDDELQTHVPCCTRPLTSAYSFKVYGRSVRCGNGPLIGDQIVTGDCGEHA